MNPPRKKRQKRRYPMGSKREKRTMDFEVRVEEKEGEAPKIVGHAAVFNQETNIAGMFREMVAPGAFANSIKVKDDVRALFNHDPNFVLGRTKSGTLSLREDDKGLWMEVTPPDTQIVRDLVLEPIRRGDISQQSFGFEVKAQEWRDGEDGELDLRTITEAKLWDVSAVTYPAYEGTDVAVRSHDEYRKSKEIPANRTNIKKKRLQLMKMEEEN
jgi:HK97 family phage prohead protease